MRNNYHFITEWKVKATQKEVYDIISDSNAHSAWWPSVYLDVMTIAEGDADNIGKQISLYTKGFLPYTLKWKFIVTENIRLSRIAIKASGDFEGYGKWDFKQLNDECAVTFDWKLEAEKPLLKYLSFLMKPLFAANHKWAMKKGEQSLQLELLRRRATTEKEQSRLPQPPQPTFPHNMLNNKIFTKASFIKQDFSN